MVERALQSARRHILYEPRPIEPARMTEITLAVMRDTGADARRAALAVMDISGELSLEVSVDPADWKGIASVPHVSDEEHEDYDDGGERIIEIPTQERKPGLL